MRQLAATITLLLLAAALPAQANSPILCPYQATGTLDGQSFTAKFDTFIGVGQPSYQTEVNGQPATIRIIDPTHGAVTLDSGKIADAQLKPCEYYCQFSPQDCK
jgi:hypothetical protein